MRKKASCIKDKIVEENEIAILNPSSNFKLFLVSWLSVNKIQKSLVSQLELKSLENYCQAYSVFFSFPALVALLYKESAKENWMAAELEVGRHVF